MDQFISNAVVDGIMTGLSYGGFLMILAFIALWMTEWIDRGSK